MRWLRHELRQVARSLALRIPALRETFDEVQAYRHLFRFAPPGHFYSPLPSPEELERDSPRLFGVPPPTVPGIDLNEASQLALLDEFSRYYLDLPFPVEKRHDFRYYFDNPAYSFSDAICLYGMIRHLRPKRIVEVGSGHSSCVMLDTSDLFLDGGVAHTFIEPYPEKLLSLLKPEDPRRVTILKQRVQDVGLAPFLALERNDILFIDSSHVVKIGSDVSYLLGEILPRLQVGVHIHVHDIFFPFEYPEGWIAEGRVWSEAYALRAFLAFNEAFEIVLFNTFLERFHRRLFEEAMPLCLRNEGGSIWLRRVR